MKAKKEKTKKRPSRRALATVVALIVALTGFIKIFIRLSPASTDRRLTCQVTDEHEKPLRGAKVMLLTDGVPPNAFTDDNGICTFDSVPKSADLMLSVRLEGFTSVVQRLPENFPSRLEIQMKPMSKSGPSEQASTTQQSNTPPEKVEFPRYSKPKKHKDLAGLVTKPLSKEEPKSINPTSFLHPEVASWPTHRSLKIAINSIGVTDPALQELFEQLRIILPQAGYEVVADVGADLVLECDTCDSNATKVELVLTSSRNSQWRLWNFSVPKLRRNAVLQFSPGEAASSFFVNLKSNRESILETFAGGLQ